MTQNDNGPGQGRNHGETAVFTFSRKVFFWLKMDFNPKKHPKFLVCVGDFTRLKTKKQLTKICTMWTDTLVLDATLIAHNGQKTSIKRLLLNAYES